MSKRQTSTVLRMKGPLPPALSLSSKNDLAWIAGFFDGEGCIVIRLGVKSNHYNHMVYVGIGQVEKGSFLLQQLYKVFGGSICFHKSKNNKHGNKYSWGIGAQKAIKFLLTIYPYLRLKKQHALLAVELHETGDYRGTKMQIPLEIYCLRETIAEEIRYLNKRGSNNE